MSLINRVADSVTGVRFGVHVCRGNWSRNEATLLRGSYTVLAPYLNRLHVSQLVLEYATERAGDLVRFDGKELGCAPWRARRGPSDHGPPPRSAGARRETEVHRSYVASDFSRTTGCNPAKAGSHVRGYNARFVRIG